MVFKIFIQEGTDADAQSAVIDTFNRCFKIRYIIEKFNLEDVKSAFSFWRNQYNASTILNWFRKKQNGFLVVLNEDIFVDGLNFVFGVAIPGVGVVLSTFRLRIKAVKEKYVERIIKTVKHEMGHYFGLGHCKNYCVMRFANSLFELDEKNINYCKYCANELIGLSCLKEECGVPDFPSF